MKAWNWKRILCFAILAAVLMTSLVAVPQTAEGFGDFNSHSDYGGSSSHSSSSDDDSDGISLYFLFQLARLLSAVLGIDSPIVVFILLVIVVLVIKHGIHKAKEKQEESRQPVVTTFDYKPVLKSPGSLDQLMEEDPGFDAEALKERIKEIFKKMQTCWEEGNIEPVRNDFMPDTWTRFNTQLQNKKAAGETTHVTSIMFGDIALLRYDRDSEQQKLTIRINVTHNIWVTDRKGKCIEGTERTRKKFEFYWTMVRPAGSVTGGVTAADATHCPNCGAEVDLEVFAECPFCHTPMMTVSPDWVISEIDAVSQTTLHA